MSNSSAYLLVVVTLFLMGIPASNGHEWTFKLPKPIEQLQGPAIFPPKSPQLPRTARFVVQTNQEASALDTFQNLRSKCMDVRMLNDHQLEFFGNEDDQNFLTEMGLKVVEKKLGRPLIRAPPAGYTSPSALLAAFESLQTRFPSRASLLDLTNKLRQNATVDGNHLYALFISDDVSRGEYTKPSILIVSNHHSRELVTPEIALNISQLLVQEYATNAQVRSIVDTYNVYVMFTVNPDGLNYVWEVDNYWRKNRQYNVDGSRGVDLNRNYPVGWDFSCGGSSTPRSETFRGTFPASEVETQTMMAFHENVRFTKVLDVHSYAREVRIIYGDCANLPASIDNYFRSIAIDIADEMNYAQARSCCMAGNIHFAYYNQGSLTFLVETAAAFQPSADEMQQELVRVQPGILDFMSLPIPVSGRIIDSNTNSPIEATIEIPSIQFELGEKKRSHPVSGLYHLWLPNGVFDIVVTTADNRSKTFSVVASAAGTVFDIII